MRSMIFLMMATRFSRSASDNDESRSYSSVQPRERMASRLNVQTAFTCSSLRIFA